MSVFGGIPIRRSLTCSRTWSVQGTFRNIVPLHPSIDFLCLYYLVSNCESKVSFLGLDQFPSLSFPNNRLHFLPLNILVQAPLTYARSVLSHSCEVKVSVRPERKFALACFLRKDTYSAVKPNSFSMISFTSRSGNPCSIWNSMIRALYGSQSCACNVGALFLRLFVGGPIEGTVVSLEGKLCDWLV
jgi:hypothetical protein